MRTASIAGHDEFKVGQAARKSAQRSRPHSCAQNDAHMHTEAALVLRLYDILCKCAIRTGVNGRYDSGHVSVKSVPAPCPKQNRDSVFGANPTRYTNLEPPRR